MPRGQRAKSFLRSLVKLAAIVIAAGGVGVAIGMGLAALSSSDESSAIDDTAVTTGTTERQPAATATQETAPAPAQTATATAPPATTTTATTTTPSAALSRLAQVRVSVLDTRLFTDFTPSGREAQRARVTVRLRAENRGDERVTLETPTLRVGSVRIPADPSGGRLAPLGAGGDSTVTLRFSLAGEATPKVVRDRRARLLVAGRSLPIRIRVQAPR